MSPLTAETIHQSEGIRFKRSDGLQFFLLGTPDGGGALYQGAYTTQPAHDSLVDFDISVQNRIVRAIQYVLAYPAHPEPMA
jgi:hypothetical protein